MRKYIFLLAAFISANITFASSQNIEDKIRGSLNRLLLLSQTYSIDNDKTIIGISDSLYSDLPLVKEVKLLEEAKVSITTALINLKDQHFAKPKRIESLINSLRQHIGSDAYNTYNKTLVNNAYRLYNGYGWNPAREFILQTPEDLTSSLNFKYYNDQGVDDAYVSKAVEILSGGGIANRSLKSNVLIKLCLLIKKDSAVIDDSLQKKSYTLLKANIAASDSAQLGIFQPLNDNSRPKPQNTQSVRHPLPPQSVYAGIEVGSSAVKLTVLQLNSEDNNEIYFKTLCEPKTIQINSRLFTTRNYDDIARNVKQFYDCLISGYHLDNKYIFIAYSSGFCNNFITANKSSGLDSLDIAIHHVISDASIRHLLPNEESAYTHIGLVQKKSLRYESLVADIGNGNTKGGFYTRSGNGTPTPNDFTPFSLTLASGTLKSKVDQKIGTSAPIDSYYNGILDYMKQNKDAEIGQVISNTRGIANKRFVYFSGGISWVLSTLLKPDNPRSAAVEIKRSDIENLIAGMTDITRFTALTDKAKGEFDRNIDKITPNTAITCVNCTTPEFIFDVFDQKLIIAGAKVMLEIMDQLNSAGLQKRYFVTTNGKLAWIMAYVLSSLDE